MKTDPEKQRGNRPVGKRFVPGQSGNPKGRPPKHECLTSLLKEELEKVSSADKDGRTWKELIVLATLKLAMKGNAAALREVCASSDINKDGVVNVLDVQLAVNAVLGLGCRSGT